MRYLLLIGVGSRRLLCVVLHVCCGGFATLTTIKGTKQCTPKRSEEEKHGKYAWIKTLVYRNKRELQEVKRMLRGLSLGLHRIMDFDANYLVGLVCVDSRDLLIMQALREIYPRGLGPIKMQKLLGRRTGLKEFNFRRRIQRMNKILDRDMGERVI